MQNIHSLVVLVVVNNGLIETMMERRTKMQKILSQVVVVNNELINTAIE